MSVDSAEDKTLYAVLVEKEFGRDGSKPLSDKPPILGGCCDLAPQPVRADSRCQDCVRHHQHPADNVMLPPNSGSGDLRQTMPLGTAFDPAFWTSAHPQVHRTADPTRVQVRGRKGGTEGHGDLQASLDNACVLCQDTTRWRQIGYTIMYHGVRRIHDKTQAEPRPLYRVLTESRRLFAAQYVSTSDERERLS
jgi:hypothetical protein